MENQENKAGQKNGRPHHGHKHHHDHHEGHDCCSDKKGCGSGQDKCCGGSCCSGHKVAKVFLGLIAAAAILLVGFSWGAKPNYHRIPNFSKGGMIKTESAGCPFNKDGRTCGCQGAGSAALEAGRPTLIPAVDAPTDTLDNTSAPLE